MEPTFFAAPEEMRAWLAQHHATARELLVGFHKVGTGQPSVTWPQSVDEALCFGWIDGVRRRVDEAGYTVRFTPRRPGRQDRSAIYAYENGPAELPPELLATLRANPAARAFFEAQPPGYRRTAVWRIVRAKQAATQSKRLEKLIAASAEGRRLF